MNTKNNKRSQRSVAAIQKAFLELTQEQPRGKVTVQKICQVAKVNRTTFYAHYLDIFDLAEQIQQEMNAQISEILLEELQRSTKDIPRAFEKVFEFVKANQEFYLARMNSSTQASMISVVDQQPLLDYFFQVGKQRGYAREEVGYHISFFINGFSAVIRYWLRRDCAETPAVMAQIIQSETHFYLMNAHEADVQDKKDQV